MIYILISETANKAASGIDLWHAVEFSSYGCALAFHAQKAQFARAAAKPITGMRARSNPVCLERKPAINLAFLQFVLGIYA